MVACPRKHSGGARDVDVYESYYGDFYDRLGAAM